MNLGRNQLLHWANSIVQAEYPNIEALADGIAYCHILQAIHPGCINMNRVTFITKLPIDCLKNIKLVEAAIKKLQLTLQVSAQKMANGSFQDNYMFTQWLYKRAKKLGKVNCENYNAYERRIQLLNKQKKNWNEVNAYLIPKELYFSQQLEEEQDEGGIIEKAEEINEYVFSLEGELKEKMELNWRMMHLVGRSIQERNALYYLLEQIEKVAQESEDSPIKKQILSILYQSPSSFK